MITKMSVLFTAIIVSISLSVQTQAVEDLPEFQYVGYRVVHHLGVQIDHMERMSIHGLPTIGPLSLRQP